LLKIVGREGSNRTLFVINTNVEDDMGRSTGRKMQLSAIIFAVLFLLVSGVSAADKPAPKTSAVLKAAGGSPGGVGFVILTGLSKAVSESYPRIELTVVPGGFVGNLMRTNVGELDIAVTTISLAAMGEKKAPPYDKEDLSKVRALMSAQNKFNFFAVVRKDLEADSIGDLFTKKLPVKLATLHKGTATELVWGSILKSQGIGWEDIKSQWGGNVSFVSWADGVNLVKDGHADGILAVGSNKIGWLLELSHARDLKMLKWDPEILDYAMDNFGLLEGKIPAGTYVGIEEDVVVPYTPCEFVINEGVPDKVVKAILTGAFENAGMFSQHHPSLSEFTTDGMAKGLRLPLHPAAEAFYKEHSIPID